MHVDLVGPLPTTVEDGYKYILTMCDRLSGYLEMVPLSNINALTVTKAFYKAWVCRYGIPENIISDQGSQFVSLIWNTLLVKLLKASPKQTTDDRPQANGKLERMHR